MSCAIMEANMFNWNRPDCTSLLGEPILKTLAAKYGKSPAQVVIYVPVSDKCVNCKKKFT